MRAGMLRNRITIEGPSTTTDDYGDAGSTWAPIVQDEPATVTPLRGVQLERALQTVGEVTHKITLRYSSAVAAVGTAHRVLFDGRQFDIHSAINVQSRNRQLELMCRERV